MIDSKDFVRALRERRITRRQFGKLAAGLGVGLVAVPTMRRPASAAGEIEYFGWSGYEDPGFIQRYIDKHGGPPNYTFWGSEEEAFAKLQAGYEPDIMAPCTYEVEQWRESGLLKPVDEQRLEHLPDMFSSVTSIASTVVDGKRWYVPVDWGNSTVIYRTDLVDPEYVAENSWNILHDERYKGRLSTFDDNGAIMIAALLLGYDNIFNLTDDQLAKIRTKLVKQRELLRFYWTDKTQVSQGLASGELVASYGWNETYVELKNQGVPVGFMVPKEGIFTWCCGLVLHANCKNDDAAYDLINAYTAPETGAYEIQTWGYGHANKKAFDLVAPDKLKELNLSTPEALLESGIFFLPLKLETRTKYNQLFEEIKAGV